MIALSLPQIARALGGELVRNQVLCPGPGHRHRDRSLSIKFDQAAPEGFLVHSFAGDDLTQCHDHVRALLGLPTWSPHVGEQLPLWVPMSKSKSEEEKRKAEWLQSRVRDIWEGACHPRRTIVQSYLTGSKPEGGRDLEFPDDVAGGVLRFHPACPWKDDDGKLIQVPAMIAAMRCIHTDQLKAVHRTRLTPDGRKVERRMFGDAAQTAIKLDPDEAVMHGLFVGEGIETTLSARQLGFRPTWALGSVGGIQKLPVLSGIDALTLLMEDDKTGANHKAVATCGFRWREAGRDIFVLNSKLGGDINDALQGRAT
jgi:putative DNA primase/helicase